MYGAAIVLDLVCDMHHNVIAPACFDQWSGIAAVEDFAERFEVSVRTQLGTSTHGFVAIRHHAYLLVLYFKPILHAVNLHKIIEDDAENSPRVESPEVCPVRLVRCELTTS